MTSKHLITLDFEVFGRVQGVFFRKYTSQKCKSLGIRGWCMNTSHDTVLGKLEGEQPKMEEMKNWLRSVGSPESRIDKAEFKNTKQINDYTFQDFSIHR